MYLYRIMPAKYSGRYENSNFTKGYMTPPEKWFVGNHSIFTMTDIDVKESKPIYKYYFMSYFDALFAAELEELSYKDYIVARIDLPNGCLRSHGIGCFSGLFIPETIVNYEDIFKNLCAEAIKYKDLKKPNRIPDLVEKEIHLEEHSTLPMSYCFKMKGEPTYWVSFLANASFRRYRDLFNENHISIYRGIISDMVGKIKIETDNKGIKSFDHEFDRSQIRVMVDTYYSKEIQEFEESVLDIYFDINEYKSLTLSQRKKALDAISK